MSTAAERVEVALAIPGAIGHKFKIPRERLGKCRTTRMFDALDFISFRARSLIFCTISSAKESLKVLSENPSNARGLAGA